jgi:Fe-S oxidoreductase
MSSLNQVKELIYTCSRCGFCRQPVDYKTGVDLVCPMGERYGIDSFYCRGRIAISRAIYEKKLNFTPQLLERIYHCLTCGNCKEYCVSLIDTISIFEALREECVKNNFAPLDAHKIWIENLKDNFNLFGKRKFSYFGNYQNDEMLFFVGCNYYYDSNLKNIIDSSIKILNVAGIKFSILNDEVCCGDFAKRIGCIEIFEKLKNKNIKNFKNYNFKSIITSCSHCYKTLKQDYNIEKEFKIFHIIELIKNLLRKEKLKFRNSENFKVCYHNPCYLGRHCKIYDAPREIIKKIPNLKFIEMRRYKENSWCCGGCGGIYEGFPNLAKDIAIERLEKDLPNNNIDYLLTSCPFCIKNLREGAKQKRYKFSVGDIIEFLAEFLI